MISFSSIALVYLVIAVVVIADDVQDWPPRAEPNPRQSQD